MAQMTVGKLIVELNQLYAKGMGNKKIVVADDSEGNGYHGMFFSCLSDPKEVKDAIDASNGLYDSETDDYNNIVIIG